LPPTPTAALTSRRRYRPQQVPNDRHHPTTQAQTKSTAMFRFTAAAAARTMPTLTADEPEVGDNRKYTGVLDCLAACFVGKKHHLRQVAADHANSSPASKRSGHSQSPTLSMNSMPVGSGGNFRDFQTGGVNCLLAGIELSGGFRMSLTDGAVIRMSKDRHDVGMQLSPGPSRQPCRQSSTSKPCSAAAPDDWNTVPRYQRHLAISRLRRNAEILRSKITQFCNVCSGTGKYADDLTVRDRLVR